MLRKLSTTELNDVLEAVEFRFGKKGDDDCSLCKKYEMYGDGNPCRKCPATHGLCGGYSHSYNLYSGKNKANEYLLHLYLAIGLEKLVRKETT